MLKIHVSTKEVWLNSEKITLRGKKYNPIDALIFMLREQQKTKEPVESFRIASAAGAKITKGFRVYDLYKRSPIRKVLESPKQGFYRLTVDLERSSVS